MKFGMIARARKVAFFNRKCSSRARKVTSLASWVAERRFHSRIPLGSVAHCKCVSAVFEKFFCESFKGQFAWQAQYSVMLEDAIVVSS